MESLARLKNLLDIKLNQNDKMMRDFPWEDQNAYANWLSQTYYYVCHSTRLLCLTGAYLSQADNQFHLRGIQHMAEEKSHEKLAFKDLQELGYSIDQFSEWPVTEALYQTVAYSILNRDPLALYGYILCLEGIAVKSAKFCAEKVRSFYSNQKVSRFLDVHGEEDPDHLVKAFDILAHLSERRLSTIEKMMMTSFHFYGEMLSASRNLTVSIDQSSPSQYLNH